MSTSLGFVLRVISSVAIVAAAATEPSYAARAADPPSGCHVCAMDITCPAPHELANYDTACQALCGYGTYAGACSTGGCWASEDLAKVLCYLIE